MKTTMMVGVLVAVLLVPYYHPTPQGIVYGWNHATSSQQAIVDSLLSSWQGSPVSIVLTPWQHPLLSGWRDHKTVRIYGVQEYNDEEFRCLLDHELYEPMTGEIHSWSEIMGECNA